MVAHVGKAKRQISPDLDLLVNDKYLAKITQLVPVKDRLLGLSVISSPINIDILTTHDQITRHALRCSEIINLGATLVRVVTKGYLTAMKFLIGRDKHLSDLALMIGVLDLHEAEALPIKVRNILMHCAPKPVVDFDSWINASNAGVRF